MTNSSYDNIKQKLQQIDPYQLEELVAEIWELEGFQTEVRKKSGDKGIDVEAIKFSPVKQKYLIQVKRYSDDNKIGSSEVRSYATLRQQEQNVDGIIIVTSGNITHHAQELANDLNVKLVDGEGLTEMVSKYSDELKSFLANSRNNSINNESDKKDNLRGEIKTLYRSKGYGFIESGQLGQDVFIHQDDVRDFVLAEGQIVSFSTITEEDGLRATNIDKKKEHIGESSNGVSQTEPQKNAARSFRKILEYLKSIGQIPWEKQYNKLRCPLCGKSISASPSSFSSHWECNDSCPARDINEVINQKRCIKYIVTGTKLRVHGENCATNCSIMLCTEDNLYIINTNGCRLTTNLVDIDQASFHPHSSGDLGILASIFGGNENKDGEDSKNKDGKVVIKTSSGKISMKSEIMSDEIPLNRLHMDELLNHLS